MLELGLNPANLRQRIQQRAEQLYCDGLVDETLRLSQRYGADLPAADHRLWRSVAGDQRQPDHS